MNDTPTQGQLRNATVMQAALVEAEQHGWLRLTREAVARRAGVADGTVSNAFGAMDEMRDAVMRAAVAGCYLSIVAEGLAAGHAAARDAPAELKSRALATLVL